MISYQDDPKDKRIEFSRRRACKNFSNVLETSGFLLLLLLSLLLLLLLLLLFTWLS